MPSQRAWGDSPSHYVVGDSPSQCAGGDSPSLYNWGDSPSHCVLGDLPSLTEAYGEIVIIRIHLDHLRDGLDEEVGSEWDRLQALVEEQRAKATEIQIEREKLGEMGVAVEDWPEHLQYPKTDELGQAKLVSFGGRQDEETPIQKVLREAMVKAGGNLNST